MWQLRRHRRHSLVWRQVAAAESERLQQRLFGLTKSLEIGFNFYSLVNVPNASLTVDETYKDPLFLLCSNVYSKIRLLYGLS